MNTALLISLLLAGQVEPADQRPGQDNRRFDVTKILKGIDRNGNGNIEPDEIPDERLRSFVGVMARRANLDPSKAMSIDKLTAAIAAAAPDGAEKPTAQPADGAKPEEKKEEEKQPVFTLDQIAAGAKNDAFMDEFIKDKVIKLYGRVLQVERWTTGDKSDQGYRVLMGRLSREDHAVDVEVWFLFPMESRKELAMLEPGTSKITVEGVCAATQLQTVASGLGLTMAIKESKIVETPAYMETSGAPPRTSILPVVTPNVPGVEPVPMIPGPMGAPGPGTNPGLNPGPAPPPVPQQPMPLPALPQRGM